MEIIIFSPALMNNGTFTVYPVSIVASFNALFVVLPLTAGSVSVTSNSIFSNDTLFNSELENLAFAVHLSYNWAIDDDKTSFNYNNKNIAIKTLVTLLIVLIAVLFQALILKIVIYILV